MTPGSETLTYPKRCILSVFNECPTIGRHDGGTYLKLANKTQKSLEEATSLTKNQLYSLLN